MGSLGKTVHNKRLTKRKDSTPGAASGMMGLERGIGHQLGYALHAGHQASGTAALLLGTPSRQSESQKWRQRVWLPGGQPKRRGSNCMGGCW